MLFRYIWNLSNAVCYTSQPLGAFMLPMNQGELRSRVNVIYVCNKTYSLKSQMESKSDK